MNKIFPSLFLLVFLYTFTTSAGTSQAFLDQMALLESSSTKKHQNYQIKNTLGYLGKYQFSRRTLKGLGYSRKEIQQFLSRPDLQEKAMRDLIDHNRLVLYKSYRLKRYLGTKIKGIKITEEGLLAAAHLVGPRAVNLFVRSGGKYVSKDAYNTPLTRYLKAFQSIKKDPKPVQNHHEWQSLYDFQLRNYALAFDYDEQNKSHQFTSSINDFLTFAKTETFSFQFQNPKDDLQDLLGSQKVISIIDQNQEEQGLEVENIKSGLQNYLDDLLAL